MVSVVSYSEVGGHRENEDAFEVHKHKQADDCWLVFLADGQGGRAGGGPAARLACRSAAERAIELPTQSLLQPSVWKTLLSQADDAVNRDPTAGLTTLIGLCVFEGQVVGASNGDSAVLLAGDEQVIELTAQQNKNPPIGSGWAKAVEFRANLSRSWSILLMSDGVWKYAGWERVRQTLVRERGQAVVESLQAAARLPGSGKFPDDFTVVLLEAINFESR